MENCIFCQIANGDTDSITIYEDKDVLAFLDKRPLFLGHLLVITKQHYETFYDLPADKLIALMSATQKIGKALEAATQSQGSFIATNNKVSQSVPHVHIHIVPRNPKDGLRGFFWPRQQFALEEKQAVAEKIKEQLRGLAT